MHSLEAIVKMNRKSCTMVGKRGAWVVTFNRPEGPVTITYSTKRNALRNIRVHGFKVES